jgi:hypothetical protein
LPINTVNINSNHYDKRSFPLRQDVHPKDPKVVAITFVNIKHHTEKSTFIPLRNRQNPSAFAEPRGLVDSPAGHSIHQVVLANLQASSLLSQLTPEIHNRNEPLLGAFNLPKKLRKNMG